MILVPQMTGSVLDVLIYVYDHYMMADPADVPERRQMLADLERQGFTLDHVVRAMEWLSVLTDERDSEAREAGIRAGRGGVRVFADGELARLSTECRAFITLLDRHGVLTPEQRELVIERTLALDVEEADIEQLKWVVLLVLSSQPGQELAFARFEDLMAGGPVRTRH
jgi:Smg protein